MGQGSNVSDCFSRNQKNVPNVHVLRIVKGFHCQSESKKKHVFFAMARFHPWNGTCVWDEDHPTFKKTGLGNHGLVEGNIF